MYIFKQKFITLIWHVLTLQALLHNAVAAWKKHVSEVPQALSVWFAYFTVDFPQQGKGRIKIFKEAFFSAKALKLLADRSVVTWMLITHWGFVVIHECSVKEFSMWTFIFWMSWKLRKIHWLTHKRQKAHKCLTVVLSHSWQFLRVTVSFAWGEMIQYSTVRQETLWLPCALSSRMKSIKEWDRERSWAPAGRIRTKAPLWTSNGSDWALGMHRRQALRVCWLPLKLC